MVPDEIVGRVLELGRLRAAGREVSVREIGRVCGISRGTVKAILEGRRVPGERARYGSVVSDQAVDALRRLAPLRDRVGLTAIAQAAGVSERSARRVLEGHANRDQAERPPVRICRLGRCPGCGARALLSPERLCWACEVRQGPRVPAAAVLEAAGLLGLRLRLELKPDHRERYEEVVAARRANGAPAEIEEPWSPLQDVRQGRPGNDAGPAIAADPSGE